VSTGERHHRARYSDETVERARDLHDEGYGYQTIARALGAPWNTVRDWCAYRTRTGTVTARTLRRQEAA